MSFLFVLQFHGSTVEDENVKEKHFQKKNSKSLIKASILKANKITLEVLAQPKTAKNDEIISFPTTYNSNNPNIFLIIKQSFVKQLFAK